MRVGDVIIELPGAKNPYSITAGKSFEGRIVKKISLDEPVERERNEKNIEVEVIKSKNEWEIGECYWVDEKYFKLKKDTLSEAEEF